VSAGAEPRVLAAQALDRCVRGGASLRVAFASFSTMLADARDRALMSAQLHAGTRWWLRFDAAVDSLLDRPLSAREPLVQALLVLGLVQLEILRLPEYAAVAATVEAMRGLGRPKFAALANALLRRWLRERAAHLRRLDADPVTRTAHPRWFIDAIAADWPAEAEAILAANNAEAPLWLRVNRRKTTREAFAARLAAEGYAVTAPDRLPHALMLEQSLDVTKLPGYDEGAFSVQDGAAQFAAELLDVRDGMRVLDACAAPGGKAAHVLESADVRLTALDRDAARLPRLHENFARLGVAADVRAADAAAPAAWWDGTPYERILLDAPCSASGVVRRQPDIKLHRRAADLPALAATQTALLDALWPLLAPGGRLVYATCSLFRVENADVIAGFTRRHADAGTSPVPIGWRAAGAGAQNLPGENGMDGFFYAVLEKKA